MSARVPHRSQPSARRPPAPERRSIGAVALVALSIAAAPGCRMSRPQPGIMISSQPPGAAVLVDGQDSGFVTPARLELSRGDWHRVEVTLAGYRPASRLFAPGLRRYAIGWEKGYINSTNILFPFYLPWEDLLIPFRFDDSLSPARVHVALELEEAAGAQP